MPRSSTFTDDKLKTAVAALREQNQTVDRTTVMDALTARHGARGKPRPEKLDEQIAAAEAELDANARLQRLGRLSSEDRARIAEIGTFVAERLSDVLADTIIATEERLTEARAAASRQYGELTARTAALVTRNKELADKLQASEQAAEECRQALATAQAELLDAGAELKVLRATQADLFAALRGNRRTDGAGEQREAEPA